MLIVSVPALLFAMRILGSPRPNAAENGLPTGGLSQLTMRGKQKTIAADQSSLAQPFRERAVHNMCRIDFMTALRIDMRLETGRGAKSPTKVGKNWT